MRALLSLGLRLGLGLTAIACGSKIPAGWTVKAPLAGPRQETAAVVFKGKLFVLGGMIEDGTPSARVEAYDAKNDRWIEQAPLPRPLHHINAAALGAYLYIAGALEGVDFAATSDCLRSADGSTWEPCTPMPSARGASAVAVSKGRLFVFGGLGDGGSTSDAAVYDANDDAWRTLPPLPVARDHFGAVVFGDEIHVIGGRTNGVIDGRVDIFAADTETWSEGEPMLTPRAGFAVAYANEAAYVFGGEGNVARADGMFPQVERYDGGTWNTLDPMPLPRHGFGAALIDGLIYLPGGGIRAGVGPTVQVDAYKP